MPTYTIYNDSWNDAQALTSDTFRAPAPEMLANLKEGDIVKISNGRERFFVEISKLNAATHDVTIIGIVSNELVCGSEYNVGDYVHFEPKHIYKIQDDTSRAKAFTDIMPLILQMKSQGYSDEEIYERVSNMNVSITSASTNVVH